MAKVEEEPGSQQVCGICGAEKLQLTTRTNKHNKPIFVCTKIPSRERVPCDGWIHRVHQSYYGL